MLFIVNIVLGSLIFHLVQPQLIFYLFISAVRAKALQLAKDLLAVEANGKDRLKNAEELVR